VDPDGERKPGHTQEDDVKPHSHIIRQEYIVSGGWDEGGTQSPARNPGGSEIQIKSDESDGQETRPKNTAVHYIIFAGLPEA
jgi:hypothetical protein